MRRALLLIAVVAAGCSSEPRLEGSSVSAPVEAAAIGTRACFPGAQGHGATTLAGRGGELLWVTSLADGGPGSLRAAVEATGPRVVLFAVAGTIELRAPLVVRAPRLTIAGESAPGGGVCLRGAQVKIAASDVLVRHLRFRLGPVPRERGEDALRVDGCTRVVLDHCSFSWGVDETCSVVGAGAVTFSDCVIAEGLRRAGHEDGDHSMGMLVRGTGALSLLRCLFMRNENRNPQVEEGSGVGLQSCLVARYRRGLRLNDLDDPGAPARVTADALRFVAPRKNGEEVVVDDSATNVRLLLHRSVGPRGQDWALVSLENEGRRAAVEDLAAPDELAQPAPPIDLARVGALPRDACDARIVSEIEGGGPDVVDDPAQVGGWPVLAPGAPEPDGDRDGVPDAWEAAHGTDPAAFDPWADPDGDGWASLEAWLAHRAERLAAEAGR